MAREYPQQVPGQDSVPRYNDVGQQVQQGVQQQAQQGAQQVQQMGSQPQPVQQTQQAQQAQRAQQQWAAQHAQQLYQQQEQQRAFQQQEAAPRYQYQQAQPVYQQTPQPAVYVPQGAESTEVGQHAAVEKPSALRSFLSFLLMFAIVLGCAWLLRTLVIAPYEIPSGSMESTIMVSDKVFSEKISYYLGDVEPGDIVTFEDPEVPDRTLIKRCIAVGGQTVDVHDGAVFIDGQQLDEPYTQGKSTEQLDPADGVEIAYPYTVPAGYIWVMGDNRTNSADSRYFGAVPASSVTGHAVCIYWPLDRIGGLD